MLQVVVPRAGLGFDFHFDPSCYTGINPVIDRQGSTCSGSGSDAVGFPFVVNNSTNTPLENAFVAYLDAMPVITLAVWYRWYIKRLHQSERAL